MKKTTKATAILLTLVLALGMATTAFAYTLNPDGSTDFEQNPDGSIKFADPVTTTVSLASQLVSFNGQEPITLQCYYTPDNRTYFRIRDITDGLNMFVSGYERYITIDPYEPADDATALETLTAQNPTVTLRGDGDVNYAYTVRYATFFNTLDRNYFKLRDLQAIGENILGERIRFAQLDGRTSKNTNSIVLPNRATFTVIKVDWIAETNVITIDAEVHDMIAVYKEAGGITDGSETIVTPTPTPAQQVNAIGELENRMLELVNEKRRAVGATALAWSDGLANVALNHSKDMIARNFFDHTNPDGQTVYERLSNAGIMGLGGENIAYGPKTAEEVMELWMNSPSHKANILSTGYSKIGIGLAYSEDGVPYWTQVFM